MAGGAGATAATQHPLRIHEFAVVLAQRPGPWRKAWIRQIRTAGPFPDITEQLLDAGVHCFGATRMQRIGVDEIALHRHAGRGLFPLGFGGQARTGPACERIGFEQTQVADRRMRIARTPTVQRELAAIGIPVQGCCQPCACTIAQPSLSQATALR